MKQERRGKKIFSFSKDFTISTASLSESSDLQLKQVKTDLTKKEE
jgi:hypothetical protein